MIKMGGYDSDKPIFKRTDDEFGRNLFVQDFTNILSSLDYGENYIISLSSKWGEGKTSAINLILEELSNNQDFVPIYVSAWALNGDYEVILWDILNQTSKKVLNKKNVKRKSARFGGILDRFSKAELPFQLDTTIDINGNGRNETRLSSGKFINTISYISQILASSDSILKARKRVEDSIKGKKVIVFVDDLDRLNGKQIIAILRALSTVADYGGMMYVLSFDKQYIISAIEEYLPKNQNGEDFLEKIIQVPINLPSLTQEMIDNNLIKKLNALLSEYDVVLESNEVKRFQRLYYWGVNRYINSPRAIKKIINTLRFKLPVVKDELNIVDVIILEIIRVFDEKFYHSIKLNVGLLIFSKSKYSKKFFVEANNSKRKADIENIFTPHDKELEVLKILFPEVNNLFDDIKNNNDDELRFRKRLGSSYYFDSFFSSIGGESSVSNKKLIEAIQYEGNYSEQLLKILETVNQNNFDLSLRVIMDNIQLVYNKLNFSLILLDLVDEFQDKYESNGFRAKPFETVIYKINEILKDSETPLDDYLTLLMHNYAKGRIETLPLLVREVDLSNKSKRKEIINLSSSEVDKYREKVLEIIQELAGKEKLPIDETDTSVLLYRYWLKFGKSKEEISNYIKIRIKKSDQVVDFLSQFLGKWTTFDSSDPHRSDFDIDTYNEISTYIEPSFLFNLLISDSKYNKLISTNSSNLISFEQSDEERSRGGKLSKLGNEKNEQFRQIVAQRFIHYYLELANDKSDKN